MPTETTEIDENKASVLYRTDRPAWLAWKVEQAVSDKSQTSDLDEDAVEVAAMAIWEEYPAPLPAYASIPERSLVAVSRGDLRRMARAAIRAYLGRGLMDGETDV